MNEVYFRIGKVKRLIEYIYILNHYSSHALRRQSVFHTQYAATYTV